VLLREICGQPEQLRAPAQEAAETPAADDDAPAVEEAPQVEIPQSPTTAGHDMDPYKLRCFRCGAGQVSLYENPRPCIAATQQQPEAIGPELVPTPTSST
jgi:hypothetical protein